MSPARRSSACSATAPRPTAARAAPACSEKGSILDSLLGRGRRACSGKVGAADRSRISGYLESVRDVERRIQRALEYNARGAGHSIDRPACRRPSSSMPS